jgi:drug/metabolite transporter (DMT)-like permease
MVLALSLVAHRAIHVEARGLALALLSGAVASGLGYVIWYHALAGLPGIQASITQLAVPVLTAVGGVLLLDERITLRLGLAAPLVLGGVALTVLARPRPAPAGSGTRPGQRHHQSAMSGSHHAMHHLGNSIAQRSNRLTVNGA